MICFAWIRLILKVYMTLPFLGQFPDESGLAYKRGSNYIYGNSGYFCCFVVLPFDDK